MSTYNHPPLKYLLVWTGDKFKAHYIRVLVTKLHKATSMNHSFVIFTDKSRDIVLSKLSMIDPEIIETVNVTDECLTGYFNKLLIFKYLENAVEPFDCLYFDLDVLLLLDSMDELIRTLRTKVPDEGFAILRDYMALIKDHPVSPYQSSMMYFARWYDGYDVWLTFNENRSYFLTKHKPIGYGDQTIIAEIDPEGVIIQDILDHPDRTVSFKIPQKRFSGVPQETWIVVFHGVPSIEEAASYSDWIRDNWQVQK